MSDITFDEYQQSTRETAIYPEAGSGTYNALQYAALGLIGEAGEVAGKIKKIYRDKGGVVSIEDQAQLYAELGDVLWYAARISDELQASFGEAATGNIAKLRSRKERGVIGGSGDNR